VILVNRSAFTLRVGADVKRVFRLRSCSLWQHTGGQSVSEL
jgi:hypothetical protein